MNSDQWFYRRYFKNWPNIAHNYPLFHENRGSTPILTNLIGVHPRNIHTKFEANPCSGLREEVEILKNFTTTTTTMTTTTDTG